MPVVDPASSALLTELYELTMALGYWREGRAEQEAAFHLYFRTAPLHGGYTIACGLEPALAYLEGLRFTDDDLSYLATLRGADGLVLFPSLSIAHTRCCSSQRSAAAHGCGRRSRCQRLARGCGASWQGSTPGSSASWTRTGIRSAWSAGSTS